MTRRTRAYIFNAPAKYSECLQSQSSQVQITPGIILTSEEAEEFKQSVRNAFEVNNAIEELGDLLFRLNFELKRPWLHYKTCTGGLYDEFIEMYEAHPDKSFWEVALMLQAAHWDLTRGFYITILKLVLVIRGKSQYLEFLNPLSKDK